MVTENQLLQEHRQAYQSFVRWGAILGVLIIVVLVLLAAFRT